MPRKNKTLIIALGVLVLLGGGYYGSTVYKRMKADASSPYTPSPRLGNLESSNLAKIEVPGIVLEKKDGVWELVSLDGKFPFRVIDLDQGRIQSMAFILSGAWAERVVDEEPADLSVYGLDKPRARTVVTDSGGETVAYSIGDMTPSMTSYYVMAEGDPKVYAVNSYSAERLMFSLNDIRNKSLFPALQLQHLTRLQLETPTVRIDLKPKPEPAPPHLASSFTFHVMTSPYKLTRGVDVQVLHELLTPLNNLQIGEFIDDSPSSLSPYGLDKPVRFFLETADASLELLIGNLIDADRYAKLAGAPEVLPSAAWILLYT